MSLIKRLVVCAVCIVVLIGIAITVFLVIKFSPTHDEPPIANTVKETGQLTDDLLERHFTATPMVFYKPENLSLTSTEHGLNFTWTVPVNSGEYVLYEVIIHGDVSHENIIQPVEENMLMIDEHLYCMDISVGVRVADDTGSVSFINYHAPAVTGLHVSLESKEELIVKWSPHPKEQECSLQYRVTYAVGGKVLLALVTGETSAVLKAELCCGQISVAGVNGDGIFTRSSTYDLPSAD